MLIRRQLRIIAGDRRTVALLALQAPIFGLIILALFPADTISTEHGPFAALLVWLLVIAATWLGASGTIREIVKELPIYRRERAVGLSIPAYVGAKAAVFGTITVVQSFLLVAIGLARQALPPADPKHFVAIMRHLPGHVLAGLRPFDSGSVLSSQWLEIVIAVALAGLAGTAVGLAISALVRKSDQAVTLLPVLLLVEMALSLPLLPLVDKGSPILLVAKVTSANWGTAAVGSTVSLNQLMAPYLWDLSAGTQLIAHALNNNLPLPNLLKIAEHGLVTESAWRHASSTWLTSVLVLIVMIAVLLAIAIAALRRLDIGRNAGQ